MIHQKFVPGSVTCLSFSPPEPYLMLGIGGGDELGVLTVLVSRLVKLGKAQESLEFCV